MKDYARDAAGNKKRRQARPQFAQNQSQNHEASNSLNISRLNFSANRGIQQNSRRPTRPRRTPQAKAQMSYASNSNQQQSNVKSTWLLAISVTTIILLFLLTKSMTMMSNIQKTNINAQIISTKQKQQPFEPKFDFYENNTNTPQQNKQAENNNLANPPQENFSTGTYHSI